AASTEPRLLGDPLWKALTDPALARSFVEFGRQVDGFPRMTESGFDVRQVALRKHAIDLRQEHRERAEHDPSRLDRRRGRRSFSDVFLASAPIKVEGFAQLPD